MAKHDANAQAGLGAEGGPQMQAKILAEALPFMQRYDHKTVVVKFGGHAMGDAALAKAFARDIVMLKQAGVNPVVVHGGGPQINAMLDKLNIKSEFAGGINKQIVAAINAEGGKAVGICGKDANLMIAKKLTRRVADPSSHIEKVVDLGFVGDPDKVDPHIIDVIIRSDLIPVVAPIGLSHDGETLNINADTFASALASAMKATRLLLLTDVPGVLDKAGKLIESLTIEEARQLIKNGTITGGMIPKVEGCIEVVEAGVEAVVILNGKVQHAVLVELFTEHGAGTLFGSARANPAGKHG